jgi:hypothetical protein
VARERELASVGRKHEPAGLPEDDSVTGHVEGELFPRIDLIQSAMTRTGY